MMHLQMTMFISHPIPHIFLIILSHPRSAMYFSVTDRLFCFQLSLAVIAMVVVCFTAAAPVEESKIQSTAAKSATDRSKRGLIAPLVASPYVASYAPTSPYLSAPYVASPYATATYTAASYAVAPAQYAVASPYVSSYATYPYVAKTFSSPYAYYP